MDECIFFAWLDGELPPGEAAEVEARVMKDPELAELASKHRALVSRIRAAFDTVAANTCAETLLEA